MDHLELSRVRALSMKAETKRSVIPAQAGIQFLFLVPRLCLGADTAAEPHCHCRPRQSLGRSSYGFCF
jgi:hypothetical protein